MSADSTVQHSSPATGGGGNTNINTTTTGISSTNTTLRDVILWRNPKVSSLVLIAATVTWVLFNVYKLSFVTVASWFTMLLVTSFFLYAHFVRFFRKEEPDLSGLRILVEKKAVEVEKSIREWSVAGMQCWLSASTNEDWKVFSMLLSGLGLLSYAGTLLDFLTLFYIGALSNNSIPACEPAIYYGTN
ncbi:Reticulon-like protein B13 [Linum grandiflorum]